MSGLGINVLTLDDLAERVATRLLRAERSLPAYTLVLGSGFSYPLIPTARGMVQEDAAWWLFRRERGDYEPFPVRPNDAPGLEDYERCLWANLFKQSGGSFTLRDGLPSLETSEDISSAYRTLMSSACDAGLSTPDLRRSYFRAVVHRVGNRINPAHLLLADLLAAQDRPGWPVNRAPFCRTIFTTNIDPLLQTSLQLCQKLYFMTDQPDELGFPDDRTDQAIHLVYAHGSVHRYRLVNSGSEIDKIRERGAELLAYFGSHGVVVIGYSGWSDVILAALEKCPMFDGNLYWCDIHSPREIATKLSPVVLDLLRQKSDTAFYVQVPSAEAAIRLIRKKLELETAPELVVDPFRVMERTLVSVELEQSIPLIPQSELQESLESGLSSAVAASLRAVVQAGLVFRDEGAQKALADLAVTSRNRRNSRAVTEFFEANDYAGAVQYLAVELSNSDLPPGVLFNAKFNRGIAYIKLGQLDAALDDLISVSEIEELTTDMKLRVFANLSVVYQLRGDFAGEIAAIDAGMRIDSLDPDIRASALVSRGIANKRRGALPLALDDFAQALAQATSGVTRAQALFQRGLVHELLMQDELSEKDFSAALEVEVLEGELRGAARYHHGCSKRRLGEISAAILDFRAVIEDDSLSSSLRGSSCAQLGYLAMDESRDSESLGYFDRALDAFELASWETGYVHSYRGIVRMRVNDLDGALEDLTSAIISQDLEAIERVRARLVRAQALILKNRQEEALEDLDHVIDSSEGGHLKVSALRIRGGIRVEQGMLDEALVDFDAVLSLEDASPEEVATVLCARGDLKCERGEREAAIADYSRALTLEVLSGAEKAEVLWNRACLFGDVGCLAEARADYEMIARLDGVPDEYKADALGNLGWLLLTMGDFVGSRISSEAAVALDSKGAGPWFNLGLANLLLGDQEKARIAYEQGCELGSPDELREALKDLENAGEDHGHPAGADEIGGLLRLRSTDPGPRTKAVDQPSLPGSS